MLKLIMLLSTMTTAAFTLYPVGLTIGALYVPSTF